MTPAVTGELASALASIAPDAVSTGVRKIDAADVRLLFPSERILISAAVERRRNEFATGRALLRQLVERDVEILRAHNGSPLPPSGTIVTLAHDRTHAVAASTRAPSVDALGIDLEPHGVVDDEVTASTVCRADERHLDPTLVFVIKEASYKAWSSRGGPMLEFHDMRIDVAGSSFRSVPAGSSCSIVGEYAAAAGHWIALAWIGDPRQA